MEKRISWIDAAKGLGILAVVMFHSGFLLFPDKTVPFVEAWMLPIFLITGGLVFNPGKKFTEFIWSKFKRLMFPFYFFGAVSFIGWLLINQGYSRDAIWMPAQEAIGFFFKGHDMWFNAPLWFLPSYFLSLVFARIIYPFWIKAQIPVKIFMIIIVAAISFAVIKEGGRTFFSWDLALLFTSFLLFGNLFSKFKEILIFPPLKTLLIGILFFAGLYLNPPVDVFMRHFNNFGLFWINAVTGSLFMVQVGYYLSKTKFISKTLSYLGKNSLTIMALHWPLMQWLTFFISFTPLFGYLHSKPLLTGFTFPRPYAIRLWVLQISLLILYTFFPVVFLEGYKFVQSFVKRRTKEFTKIYRF